MSEVTDHTFIFLYMTIETPTIGEILKQEFLDPLNITPYRLAKELHVATSTILDILHDRRKLSVEMALRLSAFFGNSSKFWLNLQNELDLREGPHCVFLPFFFSQKENSVHPFPS